MPKANRKVFTEAILSDLEKGKKHDKRTLASVGAAHGITDPNLIKELTELAVVLGSRSIIQSGKYRTTEQRFEKIVQLYENQANLSHRTSQSILLQQYSTPAPISYLASQFVYSKHPQGLFFEPSAGNGLLTIAIPPAQALVNEMDQVRHDNLETQGFKEVLQQDASMPFSFAKRFDGVLTNPPFGSLGTAVQIAEAPIKALDHLMAIRALDTMKDEGRAAIIIGGHTAWDEHGRIQAGKSRIFYAYLHKYYRVLDSINISGKKLYTRQGTGFDVRLILIDGRKSQPGGFPPLKGEQDIVVDSFYELYRRVSPYFISPETLSMEEELELLALELEFLDFKLNGPYIPASESCNSLETMVPDSMDYETHQAAARIKEAVGGSIDNFVQQKLGYSNREALCKALAAEQVDAVGMAIYNMEYRSQGMIIGDQTGIGKGRVAAAIIRYGVARGYKPIFLTEKANLFSDIHRDLSAIGAGHLRPFIVNARDSKTHIKDGAGKVVHKSPDKALQDSIYKKFAAGTGSFDDLAGFDFIVATYSQFNSAKPSAKQAFLRSLANDNIVVLDEAHNSSGSSNTGAFLQSVAKSARGVTFLSATFAKRADNMPIYAMKTAMADANMTTEELIEAIREGGVALQEVLASQLVEEGQMLRRERSFEGVEVNYLTLTTKEQEHRAVADRMTEILRDIISFQADYITPEVKQMDKIATAEGKEVELTKGTNKAGVDNLPYFSKIFQVINQMLFAIKAEAVAERAIERLKQGKKPVIAFASTMGSFLEQMEDEKGQTVQTGSIINADFTEVLHKGLDGVLRYTETDAFGKKVRHSFDITTMSPETQAEYRRIKRNIEKAASGITISPIDVVKQKIETAGYRVAEVTGRKLELQINFSNYRGLVQTRKKLTTNDAFRRFNDNEVDVLMINQSGSTGASAHAIPTEKVKPENVKQRVMIVLQAELDINTEVQKRGRINRTGQIKKPIYDYIMSAIPAEKRLMMMLQKKLKSLDANTTSNQKQSSNILHTEDFLNKYGDRIVKEYLEEHPEINVLLDDPLKLADSEGGITEGASHKVSGRVAVLSTQMQEQFYNDILERHASLVEYLQQVGDYDLEVEVLDLQAELVRRDIVKVGKNAKSVFGDDSYLETVRAKVLRKPFRKTELDNLLAESLSDKSPGQLQEDELNAFEQFSARQLQQALAEINERYFALAKKVRSERRIAAIKDPVKRTEAIKDREKQLEEARLMQRDKTRQLFENRAAYLKGIFKFFYPGRVVYFPVNSYDGGSEQVPAVFLGYLIDHKRPNPYAPSAIKLRFALASSQKYLVLQASGETGQKLQAIKGASYGLSAHEQKAILEGWDELIKKSTADSSIRHIVTGNLLQAFATFKGKLISFTSINGQERKGILMPESWDPELKVKGNVQVPIIKALKVIQSLTIGQSLSASLNLAFIRQANGFKVIVPASRKQGGDIYLDEELIRLTQERNFHKMADKMVAMVAEENLQAFIERLQEQHNLSVSLSSYQFEQIEKELEQRPPHKHIKLPEASQDTAILEMEMELELLALELELLNFNVAA